MECIPGRVVHTVECTHGEVYRRWSISTYGGVYMRWSVYTVEYTQGGVYIRWSIHKVRHTHNKTYNTHKERDIEGTYTRKGEQEDLHTEGYIHGVNIHTEEIYNTEHCTNRWDIYRKEQTYKGRYI